MLFCWVPVLALVPYTHWVPQGLRCTLCAQSGSERMAGAAVGNFL